MQLGYNSDEVDFFGFMNNIQEHMESGDEIELRALIDEIARYDVFDFIARVSSLNLLIENQNKSFYLMRLLQDS